MKAKKILLGIMAMALVFSGCNLNNTTKGGLIGGAGGGALGAGLGAAIGALAGGSSGAKLGAAIGAGVGVAGGTTAGILIGKKMDKAKAAAEAVANAQVETTTDKNGLEAVKVTFDNGILFKVGKSDLQAGAQSSLRQFANNVLNVYTDCDVAIYGFASSDGSDATNLTLSQNRANAVRSFLTGNCGVSNTQIKSTTGYGEDPNYLVYDANGKEDRNASRRVEVYLYASEAMINAANAASAGFDLIKNRIAKTDGASVSKGTIILATVEGDIHDIGKNIVKVVLENYGYTVIDLGRDVPPEKVLKAAQEHNVKLIGLSALMTTTLPSMEKTIKVLREAGHPCKVVVGGAVVTREYAAQIGADFYAKDARETVEAARAVFS